MWHLEQECHTVWSAAAGEGESGGFTLNQVVQSDRFLLRAKISR